MDVSVPTPQKPKKVLYVITLSDWGGAQKYVFELACAAKARGCTVQVVIGHGHELTQCLHAAGVTTISLTSMRCGIGLFSEISSLFSLIRIIWKFQPDIVHGNSSKAGLLAALAARICSVKEVIFTSHGWAFNETKNVLKQKIYQLFHNVTIILNDRTICVSDAIYRDAQRMWFTKTKLVVIHLGIQEGPFLTREVARTTLVPGSTTHPLWIGAVARLDPVKQLDVLIRAFSFIAARDPQSRLVIVGEGGERAKLEEVIRSHFLQKQVFLIGHRQEAQRYMKAFDIIALPSLSESFGFVIAEAGLANVSVVASNVGGVPEIITNNETGLLVPTGDEHALADALHTLAQDPALRARYGTALREHVLQAFTESCMLEKTFALYGI
jgi:glycosyltransferase involved in cell wall biosynthesis